jgi:hypothetical protein
MHERTNIQLTAADRKKLESVVATIRKAQLASEDLAFHLRQGDLLNG